MEIFLSPDGWLLLLKGAFAGILGFCGGAIVAGGYIALVVKVGIITRMSARTKTASYSRWYEDMLVCGAVLGSLYSVFHWKLPGKWLFLVPYGFFCRNLYGMSGHRAGGDCQRLPDLQPTHPSEAGA